MKKVQGIEQRRHQGQFRGTGGERELVNFVCVRERKSEGGGEFLFF